MTEPTEWTVRLRDGVRYSDAPGHGRGRGDRAEDVPGRPRIFSGLPRVADRRQVDDRTFRLTTKNPVASLD